MVILFSNRFVARPPTNELRVGKVNTVINGEKRETRTLPL